MCRFEKREKKKQESPKSTGLNYLRLKRQSSIQDEIPILAETDSVMEIYEPFLSDGFVSLKSDNAKSTPIKNLTRYWCFSVPYLAR